jgi:ankyrin repeat protein
MTVLLEAGADPNAALPEGETVLMTAARTGEPAALKALLDRGAQVNAKEAWHGQTALMWAAGEGHAAAVDELIRHGAEVDARSNGGLTSPACCSRRAPIPTPPILEAPRSTR